MRAGAALASGLAGATALSAIHEGARHLIPRAPRIHVLGERALARSLHATDAPDPGPTGLYLGALAGEMASNAAYYALVGVGGRERALAVGAALGAAAGIGAVLLPGPLGLGSRPSARTPLTRALTVAWYTIGGLVAGAAYQRLG